MGGKGSAPPAPDYAGMAREQGIANKEAAIASAYLSNPNMKTATGTRRVTYSKDPVSGNLMPTITDELTPEAQRAFEAQQRVDLALSNLGERSVGRVEDVMGKGFQYGGPNVQTSLNLSDVAKMPINAGTTAQQAIMARLNPQIEQNREATRQNLANQGITPGSEAWNNAMREQQQGESDLYSQAALQGIQADIAANAQGFNQAVQAGQFANTAGEQDYLRQLGLYNMPLNQVAALLGQAQIQMPQFQGYQGQNIEAAPIFQAGQAQEQANMARYNADQASKNALMSGLFSLGGAAAGGALGNPALFTSDRRMKTDIEKIGKLDSGLNLYKFKYIGNDEQQVGVMSDEVREVFPDAVIVGEDGFDRVDYSKLV